MNLHGGVWAGALATAVVTALALPGGGFGGVALGIAVATVWLALIVLLLAGRLPAGDPAPALIAAAACLLALLALTALSTGWTSSDETAFEEAVRLAGYLGAFLLAGLLARRDRIGPALAGLAAAGVIVAAVALGSRLLGIGSGDAALVAELPSAAGRLSFPVGYWNALGALMALALPPLCWLAAQARSPRLSGLALAGFPPLIATGYMTSSRGAVLAAALGLAVTIGCSPARRRSTAAAALGLLAAAPAVIVATLASGLLDSPGDGSPGRAELVMLAALLAGIGAALLLGGRLVGPLSGSRAFSVSIPVRYVVAAVLATAAVLVAAAGPSALIGDLRAGTDAESAGGNTRATGIISASGSGRAQFWDAALGAFAAEPLRGIGAGGFGDYWNQHGTMKTPARNAHSEPIEVLAELGIAGFVCFAGLIALILAAAIGRVGRTEPDEGAGAALGLIAAGLVGIAIDWTWQVPAVAVPVLLIAGMSCGLAAGGRERARLPRLAPRLVALVAIAVGVPAVWAAAVLAISTAQLQDGEDALAAGDLNEAAAAARSAAAIAPWATEPWLQLADVEQAGGNLDASLAAVTEAIRRDPSSLRAWLLATNIEAQRGDADASLAYGRRALELSPVD